MNHAAAVTSPTPDHATDSAACERSDDGKTNDSCGGPWGSATCISMSECSLALSEPAASTTVGTAAIANADPGEPLARETVRTDAPELPPPRA